MTVYPTQPPDPWGQSDWAHEPPLPVGSHVYIHIPFCGSKCVYCDFVVSLAKHGGQQAYQQALLQEVHLRWGRLPAGSLPPIATVYIGGGTPSELPASFYRALFNTLSQYADFLPAAEVTLELNPDNWASPPEDYLAAGFNRFSLGVQSLNDFELKKLSRRHDSARAHEVVHQLAKVGADNLSVDLMYGLPCQTLDSWRTTLQQVVVWPIRHVSFYGLKVEESTPLDRLAQFASYALPSDDDTVAMYDLAVAQLAQAGFYRYEFSNAARVGSESQHNRAYWANRDYWAFGVGAHGYQHPWRQANTTSLPVYQTAPLTGESHWVSALERLENRLIFGLRQRWGISWSALLQAYPTDATRQTLNQLIAQEQQAGRLRLLGDRLILSPEWISRSNEVFSGFIAM